MEPWAIGGKMIPWVKGVAGQIPRERTHAVSFALTVGGNSRKRCEGFDQVQGLGCWNRVPQCRQFLPPRQRRRGKRMGNEALVARVGGWSIWLIWEFRAIFAEWGPTLQIAVYLGAFLGNRPCEVWEVTYGSWVLPWGCGWIPAEPQGWWLSVAAWKTEGWGAEREQLWVACQVGSCSTQVG